MNLSKPFFSGIGGAGMSALAQYLALQKHPVSGSDRAFDQHGELPVFSVLKKLGVQLFPQDGSGIQKQNSCLILSSAIEGDNPEIAKAKSLALPIYHRSDVLRTLTQEKKSISVAGTSGKSTVTAMIFEMLSVGGLKPSLLTGAGLKSLRDKGLWGNAYADSGAWLVFEADESDGTLVQYQPEMGVLLNVDRDHKEMDELFPIFQSYLENIRERLIYNLEDTHSATLNLKTAKAKVDSFATDHILSKGKKIPVALLTLGEWHTQFSVGEVTFHLPLPGHHNFQNALAAIAVGLGVGLSLETCAKALKGYKGIDRRFHLVGQRNGLTVIDDFAHNPVKIQASLNTVKNLIAKNEDYKRLIAIFHPHGYGPLKLMQKELTQMFAKNLGPEDILILSEAYYAGGTAEKSPSSNEVAEDLKKVDKNVKFIENRPDILPYLKSILKSGDVVLNMGARDPKLSVMATEFLSLSKNL